MTFTDILAVRSIRFRRATKPNEITVCCPFCVDKGETADTRFRLGINIRTGEGHCYNCGWASRRYAMKAFLRKLGEYVGDIEDLPGFEDETPERKEKPTLPESYERLTPSAAEDDLLGVPWHYLKERGLSDRQIKEKRVGVCLLGRYAYRVVFPVYLDKKLMGFVARDYTNRSKARYLNSNESKSLYNLLTADGEQDRIVLSEGIFKALRIERATKAKSAAMLGNTITEEQVSQLTGKGYRCALIWPDPNTAGLRGALESAERLSDAGLRVDILNPVPKIEADNLPFDDIRASYGCAAPYSWQVAMEIRRKMCFHT